jgi:hypothetical protein
MGGPVVEDGRLCMPRRFKAVCTPQTRRTGRFAVQHGRTGRNAAVVIPRQEQRWRFYATPLIVDGTIYLGYNGKIYAVEEPPPGRWSSSRREPASGSFVGGVTLEGGIAPGRKRRRLPVCA